MQLTQGSVIELVVLIILLVLSSFFSGAESAFSTVNRIAMKSLTDDGDARAKRANVVIYILDHYQKFLSTILLGNNIVNLSASALMTVVITNLFGSAMVGVGTGILTVLILIFGEITPKSAATAQSQKTCLRYAYIINFLMVVFTPLVVIVDALAGVVLRALHIDRDARKAITEKELRTYVDASHEDGVIESEEKEMIINVFDFGDTVAKDVMIPRIDMSCVSADADYDEVKSVFHKDMYTRIPVYEDNQDNIIGLINIKDIFFVKDKDNFHVKNYLRKAYYTYEYKKTADLMEEMRSEAYNVAFVLSEYGTTVGMITLEDLLEEIVGEIRDEYDQDEALQIRDLGDGKYLIEGAMKLDDINNAIHTDFESEDYDSIGGLMIGQLDRLPYNREVVRLDNGITLAVRGIQQHRIMKVLMTLPVEMRNKSEESTDEPVTENTEKVLAEEKEE
ncbi:MAG: hemolysin family protein [Butyrivibrio sp.]|uniref:HlyC/CorC family transporter n=1 Tax=Butyrivibrio sp. TaxID=28121 RepID=UPI0025F08039|nr:hemolysin family protein [Butyrivibrio sp.]MCR5770114.1 hemolysin family protein [Butyrivibrio sp.]